MLSAAIRQENKWIEIGIRKEKANSVSLTDDIIIHFKSLQINY